MAIPNLPFADQGHRWRFIEAMIHSNVALWDVNEWVMTMFVLTGIKELWEKSRSYVDGKEGVVRLVELLNEAPLTSHERLWVLDRLGYSLN